MLIHEYEHKKTPAEAGVKIVLIKYQAIAMKSLALRAAAPFCN